jgi:predicted MPP superfamily phosphohydrolase
MTIFILVVITLLGLIHWFLYARLVSAFGIASPVMLWTLRGIAAYLTVSYITARISERHLPDLLVQAFHWIASVWIGLMWELLWLTAVFFLIKLLLILTGVWSRLDPLTIVALGRYSGLTVIGLAVVLCGYGMFKVFSPARIVDVQVPTRNLTKELRQMKIAVASDIHAGVLVAAPQIRRMMDRIASTQPDLVLLPGDLVDADMSRIGPCADEFRSLNPTLGVFATTGNHEYYAGLKGALEFCLASHIHMLMNEHVELPGGLIVAGLEDRTALQMGRLRPNVAEFISAFPKDKTVLLLNHTPEATEVQTALKHGASLVVSGHTHAGQIWPFSILTKMTFLYHHGLYAGPGGGYVAVSTGLGYWGPPMRLNAPAEIMLIRFVGENEPATWTVRNS